LITEVTQYFAGIDPVGITGSESELSDQAIGYSRMKVEVYGGDHSPWVQSELLVLHEKGIEPSLRPLPPFKMLKR